MSREKIKLKKCCENRIKNVHLYVFQCVCCYCCTNQFKRPFETHAIVRRLIMQSQIVSRQTFLMRRFINGHSRLCGIHSNVTIGECIQMHDYMVESKDFNQIRNNN